jgi:protocatechuate 3,4-dioxygenase, alpha subunit
VHLERTPSQTVGPFFHIGLGGAFPAELVSPDAPGAVLIHGRVLDGEGSPVPDALVELWQPGANGGFARSDTVDDGRFSFVVVKPERTSGAPHLNLGIYARGLLKRVSTRIYFPDEAEANAADPLLVALDEQLRRTLVAVADGDGLRFDIHLQGESQTAFFTV